MTNEKDKKSVAVLIATLECVWKFLNTSEIPMQQVLTFLHIAYRGEMPMGDLEKLTGVGQSSVSRNVARIGPGPNPKEPGYKLVEAFEDPFYRKRKLVRLSPRGKDLIVEIDRCLGRAREQRSH